MSAGGFRARLSSGRFGQQTRVGPSCVYVNVPELQELYRRASGLMLRQFNLISMFGMQEGQMSGVTNIINGRNLLMQHILDEHKYLEELFKLYENLPDGTPPEKKLKLGWEMIRQVSMHGATEEMVLYPIVAKLMGKEAGDRLLHETQEVKNWLAKLNNVNDPHDPQLDELVTKAIQVTREHVADEEQNFLPRLAELATLRELDRLGKQFEAARGAAPTRPHPYAPNKPPLNFFTNSTAMALDTVRDVMRFGPGNIQTTVGQVAPREVLTR